MATSVSCRIRVERDETSGQGSLQGAHPSEASRQLRPAAASAPPPSPAPAAAARRRPPPLPALSAAPSVSDPSAPPSSAIRRRRCAESSLLSESLPLPLPPRLRLRRRCFFLFLPFLPFLSFLRPLSFPPLRRFEPPRSSSAAAGAAAGASAPVQEAGSSLRKPTPAARSASAPGEGTGRVSSSPRLQVHGVDGRAARRAAVQWRRARAPSRQSGAADASAERRSQASRTTRARASCGGRGQRRFHVSRSAEVSLGNDVSE